MPSALSCIGKFQKTASKSFINSLRAGLTIVVLFREASVPVKTLLKKLTGWYRGKYIPIEAHHEEGIPIVSGGYYRQPPLAKVLSLIIGLFVREWKWAVGTILGLIGVLSRFF